MTSARRLHYDYDEYLAALEASPLTLEYCDGEIYAMVRGTPLHAQLAAAVIVTLARTLPKNCRLSTSDMKVRVEATDLTTFPDVSVVCGKAEVSKIDSNAVVNPSVLIEVTSKSTEDYDRGDKLSHYKQIPQLRAVLFVSHRSRRVTLVERTGGTWTEKDARGGERVTLASDGIDFAVDELYEGLTLDPA